MTTEVFEQSAKPARLEAAHEREATTKPIEGGAQSTTSHNVYYVNKTAALGETHVADSRLPASMQALPGLQTIAVCPDAPAATLLG